RPMAVQVPEMRMVTLIAVVKRQPSSRRMTPRPVYEPRMSRHVTGGGGVGVGRGVGVGSGVGGGRGARDGVAAGAEVRRPAATALRGAVAAAPPPSRIFLAGPDDCACRFGGGSG